MARKLKRDNPANTPRTLKKLPGGGPVSSQDSLRHQAGKTMDYEYTKGNAQGKGLSNYGNPALNNPTREDAVNWYMTNIAPQLSPYKSAMEKGEAGDFLYNTGRDPKTYAYQEYLKKTDPTNTTKWQDTSGNWKDRKTTKGPELDSLYQNSVGKMSENDRRIMMNKGRDFYYKNINNPSPGVPNDAYENTWKGRIWNTNSYPGGGSIPHSETTQMFNKPVEYLNPNSKRHQDINVANINQQKKYDKEVELEKARLRAQPMGVGRKEKLSEDEITDMAHRAVTQRMQPNEEFYGNIAQDAAMMMLPEMYGLQGANGIKSLSKFTKGLPKGANNFVPEVSNITQNSIVPKFISDAIDPTSGMRTAREMAPNLSENAYKALHQSTHPMIYGIGSGALGAGAGVVYSAANSDPDNLFRNMAIGAGAGFIGGNMLRNKFIKQALTKDLPYYQKYDANRAGLLKALDEIPHKAGKDMTPLEKETWLNQVSDQTKINADNLGNSLGNKQDILNLMKGNNSAENVAGTNYYFNPTNKTWEMDPEFNKLAGYTDIPNRKWELLKARTKLQYGEQPLLTKENLPSNYKDLIKAEGKAFDDPNFDYYDFRNDNIGEGMTYKDQDISKNRRDFDINNAAMMAKNSTWGPGKDMLPMWNYPKEGTSNFINKMLNIESQNKQPFSGIDAFQRLKPNKLGGSHMNKWKRNPQGNYDYSRLHEIIPGYHQEGGPTYPGGGSPCMTCGGAKMDEGGASNKNFNNPDFSQNQKNNFINWLKNTSMEKVHEEITNDHNQFIQDFTMKMMGGGLGQGDPSKGTRPEEINRPFKKNGGWTGINKQYPRYRLGAETHDFGGIYPELGKGGSTKDTTNNTPYFIKKADLIQEHKKALDLLSQLIPGYNTPLPIVNPQPNYQVHNQPQMAMNSGPLPDVDVSMDRHFKKGGHWIPKNLKKGRCTPLGNPDCRPGTPQYNLAVTFKKHHGFHKKNYGGDISIPNLEFGGDDTMAYGGQYPDGGSQMGPPIPDYDYTKQVPPGYVLEPDQPGFQDYGQQQPNPNTQSQPYGYNIPTNTNDAMAVTPYGGTNQDMQYSQNIQNNYANINNLSGANTRNKIVGNQRGMRNEANNPTMDPNYKLPSGNKGFNMNFSSPGPDTKIAGIEALTAFINQGQEKQKMKFLKDRTHADQLWNSQQGSRGDYSTNEGYFRPDQQVPVQFAGSAGLRKFGGISGPKKGDTLDLTEEQINQLISQGYKIKLA